MRITALTCTFERPEAFALCKKYLAQQTRQPDQWLVLDGPDPMIKKVLDAIEGNKIEGDAVVVIEDDDAYSPDWIRWCSANLQTFDLVGEAMAFYYNVRQRWWSDCSNVRHASLCSTAFNRVMLESIVNIIRDYDCPWMDTLLWRVECRKFLHLPKTRERRVIGIKGMPGKSGYSGDHRKRHPVGSEDDPSMFKLWQMLGDNAEPYAKFYERNKNP